MLPGSQLRLSQCTVDLDLCRKYTAAWFEASVLHLHGSVYLCVVVGVCALHMLTCRPVLPVHASSTKQYYNHTYILYHQLQLQACSTCWYSPIHVLVDSLHVHTQHAYCNEAPASLDGAAETARAMCSLWVPGTEVDKNQHKHVLCCVTDQCLGLDWVWQNGGFDGIFVQSKFLLIGIAANDPRVWQAV